MPPLNAGLDVLPSVAQFVCGRLVTEFGVEAPRELKLAASGCVYLASGVRCEWKMNLLGEEVHTAVTPLDALGARKLL